MGSLTGTLVGYLGQDAKQRQTPTGKTVVSLSIAVDNGAKENKVSDWLQGEVWGDYTKLLPYLLKGQQVIIPGEYRPARYTDKETGEVKSAPKWIGQKIILGAPPKEKPRHTGGEPFPSKSQGWGDEDIPF